MTPASQDAALDRLTRTLRWISILALLLLAGYVLVDMLLLTFAAVLIATLLRGASDWLSHLIGLRPAWTLAIIVLTIVVLIGLLFWWRGPEFVAEGMKLWQQLKGQLEILSQMMDETEWGRRLVGRARDYLSGAGGSVAGAMAGFVTSTLGVIGSLVVVIATALYFAAAPELYVKGSLRLLPPSWRERAREIIYRLGKALRWWFLGQAMDMAVVAILSGVGLMLLGVPLAFTLALIAGLLNFVPYIGALAGAVPAVLVGLGQGVDQALWVAALYIGIQTLEGNVIAPLIQRRTVRLPPALTILSQTVLGTLFGLMGLILATPLAVAGLISVRLIYVGEVLGDRQPNDDSC